MAFAFDGSQFVTGGGDGIAKLWDQAACFNSQKIGDNQNGSGLNVPAKKVQPFPARLSLTYQFSIANTDPPTRCK